MGTLDAYANTQYRPVSTVETGTDHPLSVRCYADMASAINNYKLLVSAPRRGQICFPYWETEDATTTPHVVAVLGPMYIPDGYSHIRYDICTRLSPSAQVDNVTWDLTISSTVYNGDRKPFSMLPFTSYTSATATTDSADWKWAMGNMVLPLSLPDELLFVTVAAANGDNSTRSEMSYFGYRAVLV